ncbi:YHS domain-containing (seleno)protein [Pelagibius sp. Alg239-R121]|uniref:YHS domain-containing (seleno)protein n=1 Tax=Pelagibius sp. Alg239-R121 TaxID=2993448 RepID=UPI0024A704D8|nr:YHS domain-containing (seleno)protein [Pelagibius sp. Alg239-R121]
MMVRLVALAALVFAAALPQLSTPAAAKDPVYTTTFSSLAVSGYDPVAYFNEGKPVEGSSDHEFEWNGVTWRFASSANQEIFMQDPEAFAPQYGGYCAWAVSQGYTASTDPTAWRIVDGKLYLNYSHSVQRRWETDVAGNIVKGDSNWPKVLD